MVLTCKVHSCLVPQWNYSTTLVAVWVKGDSGSWMTCPRNHSQKILVYQDVWPPSSAVSTGSQLILHGHKTVAPPGDQNYKSLCLPHRTFVKRQWGNGYERADIIIIIIAQFICICIFFILLSYFIRMTVLNLNAKRLLCLDGLQNLQTIISNWYAVVGELST